MIKLYYLEQIINGITQGSIYALVAIGFTLILGVTGLVTFCYGETVMIGGYAAFYVFTYLGLNLPLAILAAAVSTALLGYIIYKICFQKFIMDKSHLASLITTLAMAYLLTNIAQIFFGVEMKSIPAIFPGQYITIGDIRITYLQLIIIGVVIFLSIILSIFLRKTRMGAAIRSVRQDKVASALVGINVQRTTTLSYCLGSALGGIAGVLFVLNFLSVDPLMGPEIGIKAFSSAIVAGMTSIPVAAISGVVLGTTESLSVALIASAARNLAAFAFIILVLIFRPQGLVGRRRESAE